MNTNYILMETRLPPESLGGSMVILMTICITGSSIAPQLAYLPYPIPYYALLFFVFVLFITAYFLPPPGIYEIKD